MNFGLLPTMNAFVDWRLADQTDSGGTIRPFVVLRFGSAEVTAWELTEDEADQVHPAVDSSDRQEFLERYVADKLKSAWGWSA
ncbi:MAG: hypothetical protein ABW022_14885 [Actinoplanes sp.]